MPLWKTKSGYRAQFQHEKKRYSKTGFPTQKAAEKWIVDKRAELEQESKTPPSPPTRYASDSGPLDLETLMVKHLRFAERNLVPSGLAYRKAVFRRFLAHVGNVPVENLGPDQVEDYLLTRPTNHNFNKERTELLVMFSWALKRRLVSYNPVAVVDKLKVEKTKKAIPTPLEMAKMLMAAGKDRPFLLVLFHTMARLDEVQRLKWEDVNFTEKLVRLWTRKRQGGTWEYDWLPMNEDLEQVLWTLWQKRTQDEWVFVSPLTGTRYKHRFTLIRNICRRAGVPHYTYHCIRHFVASYLYDKKKVSLPVISKLLRHKSLQTTEIYLQAIAPNFRETMRLLEGNVMGFLGEPITAQENLLTRPTHLLTNKERVQGFEP
jgi:integrase